MTDLQVVEALAQRHFADEKLTHVFFPKAGVNALALTEQRIFGVSGAVVEFSVPFDKLTSVGVSKQGDVAIFAAGQRISSALLAVDSDVPALNEVLTSKSVQIFELQPVAPEASAPAKQNPRLTTFEQRFPNTQFFGTAPREALLQAMEKTSIGGDSPWLLINSGGGAGALYAYEDRLVIAKVGALTSFMADSFGAGRVSTLPFNQITGIEYNGGMVSGVLEVLTPSYQGTKNQDYWRGTGAKRNTDRNSPWTLSNTLPLGVSEYKNAEAAINELRAKIIAYQRPSVTVNAPVAPANDLATQISNLKQLLDQGALTQAEFEKAKQKLLDA